MKLKDLSVETQFHWLLTGYLFYLDHSRRAAWGNKNELILTSGSEPQTKHKVTSLHYAIPGCACDVRSWDVTIDDGGPQGKVNAEEQAEFYREQAITYCEKQNIPRDWIEIIVESTHIHIELQPKRQF